jgi:hypothetical protein
MEASACKTSRKWHPDQEKLFLEHLVRPELKPIGGEGDGVMERKVEARWVPLLQEFRAANPLLVERLPNTCGLGLKVIVDVKTLQRKWQDFKDNYGKLKRECGVGRHQL